ncbi:MAG: C4-dicarboxylate transporter permease [Deltaproteobacteria bacterium]|nr:C4-dicarboxylate transporter permease [Deltaproteobacteria bacterium]
MGLERLSELLRKILMIIGGVSLLGVTLLATSNVALRIFRVPVSGAYEVVSFLGAIVSAGALGYTQKHRCHIVVDILSSKYPPRIGRAVDALSHVVMSVLFSIVSWQTVAYGRRLIQAGEVSETLKIPFHPFVFLVAFGFAALALTSLIDFFETVWTKEEKR